LWLANTQIGSTVIESISVGMVNMLVIGRMRNQAMQIDDFSS